MKINKSKASHWWALIRFSAVCIAAFVKRHLFGKAAQKPIVLLYGHKLNSNLKALYQSLEKESETYDFYFLTMDKQYHTLLNQQNINALYACSASTINTIANTGVIVSDHGLHCLQLFLGRSNIKFMDVWHGLPFKGFDGDDFKVQHQYDTVCVTSEYVKTMYAERFGFDTERLKTTGYGRTDLLLQSPAKETYIQHNIPNDQSKIILYAPTWKQDSALRSIYPFDMSEDTFLSAIDEICSKQNAYLVVRTHLNSSEQPTEKYKRVLYRPHSQYPDTESLLSVTDILICDWSSISLDFLVLHRPTIYLNVPHPFAKGLSLGEEFRAGCIADNSDQMLSELSKYLTENGSLSEEERNQFSDVEKLLYDENTDGNSGHRYLAEIRQLL